MCIELGKEIFEFSEKVIKNYCDTPMFQKRLCPNGQEEGNLLKDKGLYLRDSSSCLKKGAVSLKRDSLVGKKVAYKN